MTVCLTFQLLKTTIGLHSTLFDLTFSLHNIIVLLIILLILRILKLGFKSFNRKRGLRKIFN